MMKTVRVAMASAALILALCLSLTACGTIKDLLDGELHGDLEFADAPDSEESVLLYHENKYYSTDRWLTVESLNDATEIGWGDMFPFPTTYFIAHDVESPLYIVATDDFRTYASQVYVREGFDWRNEVFVVEDTEIEVVPAQVMTLAENDAQMQDQGYCGITLYCKDEPRLMLEVDLYQTGEDRYFVKDGERWFLTDEFVSLLKEHSVISD